MRTRITFFFLVVSTTLFAQFTSIEQNITNSFTFVEISEEHGVSLIGGIRASKSQDEGYTWTEMDLGILALPYTGFVYQEATIVSPQVYFMVGLDDNLNRKGNIIRSTDGGDTWTSVFETANGSNDYIYDIENHESVIIASAKHGVYRSVDLGETWEFSFIDFKWYQHIHYNEEMNVWITTTNSSSDNFLISYDDGLNWQTQQPSGILTLYNSINQIYSHNGLFYFLQDGNLGNGSIVLYESGNSSLGSIPFNSLQTSASQIERSFFLPDDNIIGASEAYFFKIDTISGHIYYYDHNLLSTDNELVQTRDFELAETFGIAVGVLGGVSRFDINSPSSLYLPASFTLESGSCPGDTIVGTPDFNYGDSVRWFYNDVLISTDSILTFVTPYQFGQQEVKMENWYNGNVRSDSTNLYFNPLLPPPNYVCSMDTTPCFNSPVYVNATKTSQQTFYTSFINVWLDNQLIYTNQGAPQNLSFTTPIIQTQDTLYFVTYNANYGGNGQVCGTTSDTTSYILYPGDDLSDNFDYIGIGDSVCIGTEIDFVFENTQVGNRYSINCPNIFVNNVFWPEQGDEYLGTPDTLIVPGPSVFSNEYYFTLTIEKGNCTQSIPFDTIRGIDPNTQFYTHSESYYLNDTVGVTNETPTNNMMWSVEPYINVINEQDTIPIITTNSSGIYSILLENEPVENCYDSMSRIVRFGENVPFLHLDTCWKSSSWSTGRMLEIERDFEKNIYELSLINVGQSWGSPGFHLVKKSELGEVLWKIESPSYNGMNFKGAVIEDIDFDFDGNFYAVMWVNSSILYHYDLLTFDPPNVGYSSIASYLVKFNGQTGEMIWVKEMSSYSAITEAFGAYLCKPSSIIVTHNEIHFTVANESRFYIVSVDLHGNYISNDLLTGNHYNNVFPSIMPFQNQGYVGVKSFRSPKLEQLNTGEIVGIAYYNRKLKYNDIILPELDPIEPFDQNNRSILVFKYTSQNGLYSLKKLASIPGFPEKDTPIFAVDNNDNIVVSFYWNDLNLFPFVLDSTISINNGSCIFQVDSEYNLNWLVTGNSTRVQSLGIDKSSNEIYSFGSAKNNVSLSKDNDHYVIGEIYDSINQEGINDAYLVRFNSDGNLIDGSIIDIYDSINSSNYLKGKIDVSPCGEVVIALKPEYFEYSGMPIIKTHLNSNLYVIQLDSNLTMKVSNNCNPTCEYISITYDTIKVCNSDSLTYIPFSESYLVDSIQYGIYNSNNELISTEGVATSNNGFYINNIQNSSSYKLKIFAPILDSIIITNVDVQYPVYSFDSIVCLNENTLITATPAYLDYAWLGDMNFNSNNTYYQNFSTPGIKELIINSRTENQCIVTDTLVIKVLDSIPSGIENNYTVSCNESLIIDFNEDGYEYDVNWILNGAVSENNFSSQNLLSGSNVATVNLIDTNGCELNIPFLINYYCELEIETKEYDLGLEIVPNPSNGYFKLLLNRPITNPEIKIFDYSGRLIEHFNMKSGNEFVFDLLVAPGIYYLSIESSESGKYNIKFNVQSKD